MLNQLWLLQTIRLIDILDIALLSFILYRTLLIIKGTRALQSLAGLFFLMALYGISESTGLSGVYWVLDKFFVYLILVIIILFQEDIRKGLARAGQVLPNFQKRQDVSTIESIIKTAFALASRRIGALIIIEREGHLDETISTGNYMDAIVSQELLLSIFLPTSPLHDGAVVIRNDRAAASKCILPLTTSKNISKIYGTRHRAAIGLTEVTDAIAIVISEERGTVGISVNGEIQVVPSAIDMRQTLQELLDKDLQ